MAEARHRDAKLRVVHAVWLSSAGQRDDRSAQHRAAGQAVLESAREFVESVLSGQSVDYVLSPRPPITTLTDESQSASCLVVGADHDSWFDRMLGGEVATWMARHAGCPVFVVPEAVEDEGRSGEVVVALDVAGAGTPEVLTAAFEAARLRRSCLRVLHVVPSDRSRESKGDAWSLLDRALADGSAASPDTQVVANVVSDEADHALLDTSRRAALLVLGRPRSLGVTDLYSPRIAMHVLRQTHCHVLVVPVQASAA